MAESDASDCLGVLLDVLCYEMICGRMSREIESVLEEHFRACSTCRKKFRDYLDVLVQTDSGFSWADAVPGLSFYRRRWAHGERVLIARSACCAERGRPRAGREHRWGALGQRKGTGGGWRPAMFRGEPSRPPRCRRAKTVIGPIS